MFCLRNHCLRHHGRTHKLRMNLRSQAEDKFLPRNNVPQGPEPNVEDRFIAGWIHQDPVRHTKATHEISNLTEFLWIVWNYNITLLQPILPIVFQSYSPNQLLRSSKTLTIHLASLHTWKSWSGSEGSTWRYDAGKASIAIVGGELPLWQTEHVMVGCSERVGSMLFSRWPKWCWL